MKSMYINNRKKEDEERRDLPIKTREIIYNRDQMADRAKTNVTPPNAGPSIAGNDKTAIKYGNYNFNPDVNYMQLMIDAEKSGNYNLAKYYENMRNAKIAGGFGGVYKPTNIYNYKSQYDEKINQLREDIENYEDFSYNPEKDQNYINLANVYHKNAQRAQNNALAQAAAMNGGRLSSNAIIAASLGYGDQMSQLEGEIPQLREAAYNMHLNNKADKRAMLNDYLTAESQDYSRWNDELNRRYGVTRDTIADTKDERNYNTSVDNYNREYDFKIKQFEYQVDQALKNEAVVQSQLVGYVTDEASKILGVPVGTPTLQAIESFKSRQLQAVGLMGDMPSSIAVEYGVNSGATLDSKALSETSRINSAKINSDYTPVNYGGEIYDSGDYIESNSSNDLTNDVLEFISNNSDLPPNKLLSKAESDAEALGYDVNEFLDELEKQLS